MLHIAAATPLRGKGRLRVLLSARLLLIARKTAAMRGCAQVRTDPLDNPAINKIVPHAIEPPVSVNYG